ncbi:hydantoinase/oxoprolinase family protein, partial [Devosia sp.]|uniref:hydantoinase/oxoprolinase family protein n=1 Tax=Devosia sp. TaxID=1871048 RepID=UPI002EF7BE3D
MPDKISRVATDVGGTFTDLVYFETDMRSGAQTVRTEKSDTTPPNFENGVLAVLDKAKVNLETLDFFAHGTTVVINALTERKGAKVGLVTTKGFRDVLEIGRGNRPDFFNLKYKKPEPFVERFLRRELPGRIDFHGKEQVPLDTSGLAQIVADFRAEGVNAVAICFIHAYANPAHEEAALAELRRLWPEVTAVASHQITREWREYERTSTTILSAYVQPAAQRYLERLEAGLRDKGYHGGLYVMQSNCGVDSLGSIKQTPITMVESGPASGFWGAAELGRIIGEPDILALDIGGTTAKCSLITGGHVTIKTDYWIERDGKSAGYPIMVPVVDLVEIGNGGGSIAWVDDFGKLHVGPQSAGAAPGPAAYGRGGTNATTTDANLALGRINRDYFCGGTVTADIPAMQGALSELGGKLGMSNEEVARGIVRIANSNMVNALKLVSVNRGYDPRDFTMVVFGGGGPMHGAELGKELGVKKVVVPRGASVFSAWGMLMSDLRRDYFVTQLMDADDFASLSRLLEETRARAIADFVRGNVPADKVGFTTFIRARYQNQEFAVEVPLPSDTLDAATMAELVASFHTAYEREYTYRLDAGVEIIGVHLVAASEVGKLEILKLPTTGATVEQAVKGRREVDYATEGVHPATI